MCLACNEEENEGDRGSKVTTSKFWGKAELKRGQRNRILPRSRTDSSSLHCSVLGLIISSRLPFTLMRLLPREQCTWSLAVVLSPKTHTDCRGPSGCVAMGIDKHSKSAEMQLEKAECFIHG